MDGKENDEESFEDYSREDVSSSAADDEDTRLPDGSILTHDDDQSSSAYARRMSTDDGGQLDDHEGTSRSLSSRYGQPLPADEVGALVPAGDGGLVWHAQLVDDEWRTAKDVDEEGNIKPRRYDERLSVHTHPSPHARATRTHLHVWPTPINGTCICTRHLQLGTIHDARSRSPHTRASHFAYSARLTPVTWSSTLTAHAPQLQGRPYPCDPTPSSPPSCRPPTGAGCSRGPSMDGPRSPTWS